MIKSVEGCIKAAIFCPCAAVRFICNNFRGRSVSSPDVGESVFRDSVMSATSGYPVCPHHDLGSLKVFLTASKQPMFASDKCPTFGNHGKKVSKCYQAST